MQLSVRPFQTRNFLQSCDSARFTRHTLWFIVVGVRLLERGSTVVSFCCVCIRKCYTVSVLGPSFFLRAAWPLGLAGECVDGGGYQLGKGLYGFYARCLLLVHVVVVVSRILGCHMHNTRI